MNPPPSRVLRLDMRIPVLALLTVAAGFLVQTAVGVWYASRIVSSVEEAIADNERQDRRISALESNQAAVNGTLQRIDERTLRMVNDISEVKEVLQRKADR